MTRDALLIKRLQIALQRVAVAERYLKQAKTELAKLREIAMTAPKPDGDGERKEAAA